MLLMCKMVQCLVWFCDVNICVRQGSVLSLFLFSVYVDDIARSSMLFCGSFLVLYANDILLISPSVCMLDKLLKMCKHELGLLDMAINTRKSCCLRIGPRYISCCGLICTSTNADIPWVDEIRYLGIFVVWSHKFKCSLDYSQKNSYYRATNAIWTILIAYNFDTSSKNFVRYGLVTPELKT